MSVRGQKLTHAPQQLASLFDHLVRAGEHRRRYGEAKRLSSLEVYNELEFGWLFDGKIARLGAVQNLVNIVTGAAKHLS